MIIVGEHVCSIDRIGIALSSKTSEETFNLIRYNFQAEIRVNDAVKWMSSCDLLKWDLQAGSNIAEMEIRIYVKKGDRIEANLISTDYMLPCEVSIGLMISYIRVQKNEQTNVTDKVIPILEEG